jgi:pyrimidine-specific ribonucleoside hydrolase
MRLITSIALLLGIGTLAADEGRLAQPESPGERPFLTLNAFPLDAKAYQIPTAELVRAKIPEKYGHKEWAAIVLTHEFHQHLGIYTTLGAKMATRAAECLDAPMRTVQIEAECSTKQPWACFADGLQAGLGSTLGQNLIRILETETPKVAATFVYQDKRLRLALKPEPERHIVEFIQQAIQEHGNLTPAYFEAVEEFSYRVWAEFDRHEIFEETTGIAPVEHP